MVSTKKKFMRDIRIVIISGSVRIGRLSHKVSVELESRFKQTGLVNSSILDIASYQFPVAEERCGRTSNPIHGIEDAQQKLQQADAMVFVSPEYHGSFSGALKNFLDYFWKEFERKPIGVASVSTGKLGGINASNQMQQLILSLGAFPMPYKLLVPSVHTAFTDDGVLTDPMLQKSFSRFIDEFSWFAAAIASARQRTHQFINSHFSS
jgi:NAD(P)H-dependent FMN reductase